MNTYYRDRLSLQLTICIAQVFPLHDHMLHEQDHQFLNQASIHCDQGLLNPQVKSIYQCTNQSICCTTHLITITTHVQSVKGKGTAVPLQVWSGPEGSRKLRFPDFMTTAQDGGKVVSITHQSSLPPGNAPGTHFC